ncbi:MAG: hypothetical protein ABJE10_14285 [bacterium]
MPSVTTRCCRAVGWGSISINGFSIGPYSIGVQWTDVTTHSTWEKASGGGTPKC